MMKGIDADNSSIAFAKDSSRGYGNRGRSRRSRSKLHGRLRWHELLCRDRGVAPLTRRECFRIAAPEPQGKKLARYREAVSRQKAPMQTFHRSRTRSKDVSHRLFPLDRRHGPLSMRFLPPVDHFASELLQPGTSIQDVCLKLRRYAPSR